MFSYFLRGNICLAPKARDHLSLGHRPRNSYNIKPGAEDAIHSDPFPSIIYAMPQSLSKVIIHAIFSTKNREPWLDSATRAGMRAYLATIGRDLGGEALCGWC